MSSPKVSVYSLADLKNTSDDALPNYLKSLKFQQTHALVDVRLALGYAAVVIAAAIFYHDYRFGWEHSKHYTPWAVFLYFALNGALTAWAWFVERGVVFQGSKNGARLSISSTTIAHTPTYRLLVESSNLAQNDPSKSTVRRIEAPFTRWFTQDGQFMAKPFQDWLCMEIPAVQQAANLSIKQRAST